MGSLSKAPALPCAALFLYGLLSPSPVAASASNSPLDAATLQQCVTSVVQVERSATFAGGMTAIGGTVRMAMRVEVQERSPGQVLFHTVAAPGLGGWRASDPKVKVYKYLKQVTNLSAPAQYRALVRFRWLGAHGRVIKRAQRVTPKCAQPEAPPPAAPPAAPGTSPSASQGAAPPMP